MICEVLVPIAALVVTLVVMVFFGIVGYWIGCQIWPADVENDSP